MNLTAIAQATLLLTCHFSAGQANEHQPLSLAEWGRLALWLRHQRMSPADLLTPDVATRLVAWQDPKIPVTRLIGLLARGHSLALALDKWQRAGLWVVTRADEDYPSRLKATLKNDSPPVIFGCGNRALLQSGGLAVVGSRAAMPTDLHFTQQLASKAAAQGVNIVSGGARGIDECAMVSALDAGGSATGVLADSLLRASTSAKWRKGLMEGRLALISPFYPEAGFTVANAMARNRYIYSLAEAALIVHAGVKGGTVTGAKEALKHRWGAVWVKPSDDPESSNAFLVQQGGAWCHDDPLSIEPQQLLVPQPGYPSAQVTQRVEQYSLYESPAEYHPSSDSFYRLFLAEMHRLAQQPISLQKLSEEMNVLPSQLHEWLDRAEREKVINKLIAPERYQMIFSSS
ncbi:MAG TPA: DNA-processing protein DprA [Klebsiella sp.]|jgi:predicted Rossmann fold nucleotide-binding protein DprA/Smf involved in DNA uptake